MNIDYFLGDGNRLAALSKLKEEICKNIYRYCLLANIDPDNFDHKNFLLQHQNNLNSMVIKHYVDLVTYCEKLVLVETKIEDLNAN